MATFVVAIDVEAADAAEAEDIVARLTNGNPLVTWVSEATELQDPFEDG